VAAALRNEPDVKVSVIDGSPGELTITVDGEEVARKGESLPEINEVVAAVRRGGTTAGAQRW
jgi:uncharacterized Zn-binding protein involved in type VI secretion